MRSARFASRHAVTYFPRVRPRGDLGRYGAGVPGCGVVAGMLARADQAGVWHHMPPVDSTLRAGLAPLFEVGQREAASLQRLGVNTFVRVQAGLVALQGNVSLAGALALSTLSQNLGISRLTSFILRSIARHTHWVFGAGGRDELVSDLERQVWIFLSRLKQRDALAGASPEQAFFVRTSLAHEPISGGEGRDVTVTLRVGFAPRIANEFLVYDFRYHALSLTTEVVPVRDAERHLG
jgi:phage tail sheath protein FI